MAGCRHEWGRWKVEKDKKGRKTYRRRCRLCWKGDVSRRKPTGFQAIPDIIMKETGIMPK